MVTVNLESVATPSKRNSSKPRPTAPRAGRNKSAKGRRATRKRVPAKLSRASSSRRRPPARLSLATRAREVIGRQLGGHTADVVGIVLMALGALSALALATNLVGPIGRALASGITFFLGGGAFLVPVACFTASILVLAPRETADGDAVAAAPLRIGLGIVLLVTGITGLLHLTGGSPALSSSSDDLRRAGGVLGAVTGGLVRAGLGDVGAGVVFICIAILGALLAPGVPLRRALAAIAKGSRVAVSALRSWLEPPITAEIVNDDGETALVAETASPPASSRRVTAAELYDQFADAEPEPEAEPDQESPVDLAEEELSDTEDADLAAEDLPSVPLPSPNPAAGDDASQLAIDLGPRHRPPVWKLPPKTILARGTGGKVDQRVVQAGGKVLEATLREFGVEANLIGMTVGPTVTRYELELAAGVKVSRVTSLNKEIAYSMASHDVRILAPIPGRSAIGVEVPNKQRPLVTLGDVLAGEEARKATNPLEVGLGRDIAGHDVMLELAKMPHLLIAGTTGAGKSSCINSIVTSILMRATPEQVRLILVDPKRVELGRYEGLPHLLTSVVTNPKKAANALDWAVREMEMRYEMLAEVGTRDIDGYNAMYDRAELPTEENPDPHGGRNYVRLPYILVVVDELSDLMMVAARDVETSVCRLAQMARAVGIHLVIATQRPSVDVITGLIKANVPSRLAFKVRSVTDSRVILDQAGAEKLVGQGDMLMITLSSSLGQRIQGAWVDEDCVRKVVAHWRRQSRQPNYVEGIAEEKASATGGFGADMDDGDELLDQAMELVVMGGLGSTSMLQRKLRVGFARAGRLMDLLERKGVVGPSEGSKARSVLMTSEELEEMRTKA